jgi:hypothetical protein
VKLLDKLSKRIDIICCTDQGHPMSPELFECFIYQFSLDLNDLEDTNVTILNDTRITHQSPSMADDRVLPAFDSKGLQDMLGVLFTYCLDWGRTVKVKKTAVVIFNPSGRQINESHTYSGTHRIVMVSLSRSAFAYVLTACARMLREREPLSKNRIAWQIEK